MVKERKSWVDALRAIAIILVIYGHCVKGLDVFFIFTSPIKMPLFFIISGYVFSMHDGNQGMFWTNWLKKLIIPWFCLALLPYLPALFTNPSKVLYYLYDLISGKELWFMPCFVIAEAIHFYIRRLAKREWKITVCCVVACVLGIMADKLDVLNFAMFNRALVVQLFFLFGFLFKQHEKSFISLPRCVYVIVVIVYFIIGLLSCYFFPNQTMDVHANRYYNYPVCLLMILFGNFLLFSVFNRTNFSNKILSFIGQNTLVFYIWHTYAFGALRIILSFFGLYLQTNWWSPFIKTIWACLICSLCAFIINKYFPWMVGKKGKI